MLTALHIMYARDTIVNALGGVVTASVQERDAEAEESKSPMELTSADLIPMGRASQRILVDLVVMMLDR